MPVPPSISPFHRDLVLFQYSRGKIKLKTGKEKKIKYKPNDSAKTIDFPNYNRLEEDGFYSLISEGGVAVVNFSEGKDCIASAFHTYLRILSNEHNEAEFYHVDTGRNQHLKKLLGIETNPTLLVIVENDIRDIISGLEDFKTKLAVTLPALKARLASSEVISNLGVIPEKPQDIDDEYVRNNVEEKLRRIRKQLGIMR